MNFSYIIAELLDEQDYVIVPGLGAFRAAHLSSRFDENGKKLLPPSKTLSFNPDVKMNDGMVTGYLVHRMKVPVSRAQKLAREFSDDVVYRLDQGEAIVLEGIGTLVMAGSQIEFSPAGTITESAGSFGLGPVSVILPAAIPPAAMNNQPEFTNGNADGHLSGADQPEMANGRMKASADKRLKAFRPAVWLALLFLIALLAAAWFLFFHKKQDPEDLKPTVTAIAPTTTPDLATTDTVVKTTEPSVGDSTLIQQVTAPREALYFVVGGSFQSRQYADHYFSEMSGKGYHPVHLGQFGTYFIVAIDSFKTEREAVRAVNHFNDRHPDAGAWIFHRKNE